MPRVEQLGRSHRRCLPPGPAMAISPRTRKPSIWVRAVVRPSRRLQSTAACRDEREGSGPDARRGRGLAAEGIVALPFGAPHAADPQAACREGRPRFAIGRTIATTVRSRPPGNGARQRAVALSAVQVSRLYGSHRLQHEVALAPPRRRSAAGTPPSTNVSRYLGSLASSSCAAPQSGALARGVGALHRRSRHARADIRRPR